MFDALKGLGNPLALMGKVREMQEKMREMQEELARKHVTADAGGGMVSATVNGRMELVRIHIDKSRVDLNDTDMLEDLIVAAVAAAQNKASDVNKAELERMANEMGLPPGMLPG
jgi:nucleoid-associated protein EbfC